MSGHSKWHNIRLRKGKQDAVRGKLFTRIAKEIIIAAQSGGGSADTNVRLRMAIQTARQNSMPSENIKRAVQRGTGELGGANPVPYNHLALPTKKEIENIKFIIKH